MSAADRLYSTLEGVKIAVESLRANKVRAALTIMGIAVGVFVVTGMAAAVHGIQTSFAQDMAAAGPTSFFLFRRADFFENCDGSDETCPSRRNPPLTLREAQILERLPSVEVVTAHISGSATFKYRDRQLPSATVDAYTPNWTMTDGGNIEPGRSFTAAEATAAARVVVINDKMAERLFGQSDPVGKVLTADGIPFTVIGVYHSTVGFLGTPTEEASGDEAQAKVPFETGRKYLDLWIRGLDLVVKPRAGVTRDDAMDDVTARLRAVRGLRPGAVNNFAVVGQDKLMGAFDQFTGNFFMIMIALASVGLLVGGVGVVAIMMISVTERTREIGVRKALGATRGTILWQFLVEAATLTIIGASTGLVIGGLIAEGIKNWTPVPAAVPPGAIAAALLGAAVTGVLFGIIPALRAARLDPVEALRYE
ncbi:MAG TPA: ABC transporter permease [Gemmatimonadaceae bacterium]|nr:ABC transporter permease [Gemmatimonadaceae bacterium]